MALEDDDQVWQQHDGGAGHWDHPEWDAADGPRAAAFYSSTRGRARWLLDLLMDNPGRQLDADSLADQIAGVQANGLAKPQLVARAFRDMRAAQTASGRRYPFYWWSENGSPTKYAMKRAVAQLFRQARRAVTATRGDHRFWWDSDPGENVYMEITRRDDMGADLKAPSAARGGGITPGYALVAAVGPGDVVVHYDSREEQIVGVSVVTGTAEPAPIYWVARGTYARRAGEHARWLPGVRVPLGRYRKLRAPVALTDIRARRGELLQLREQLQERAPGQALYFPWIPYQDTLRTFQSYLVKLPRAAIGMFPQLRAAVEQADATSLPGGFSPVEQAEDAVDQAAGRAARRGRGQGFQVDQAAKVAVEAHAMNAATDFFSGSWTVEDVHGRESYDLVCRRGHEEMRVEVKGTTTDGTEVILTPNEVEHARSYGATTLFILSKITLEHAEDGAVRAAGGVSHVFDPWIIDDGVLTPVGFRYQPPRGRDRSDGR
jgi:Family of unknown function (DUF6416)/Domain of unknown function (DUF3883)